MTFVNKSQQKGFTIIAVMIISLMTGTAVLNSLQDNVAQERLTGNFQKKLTARLLSEKGIFDATSEIQADLLADPATTAAIFIGKYENGKIIQEGESIVTLNQVTPPTGLPAGDYISLSSVGKKFEGRTRLEAIYRIEPGTSLPPINFDRGVTGCEKVDIGASGGVNSYNSAEGEYGVDNNIGESAVIKTLQSKGSGITLSGAADIDGDLISAHGVTFNGSANITGEVKSNEAINITGNVVIGGNASTVASYKQSGGSVGGTIHANGFVVLSEIPVTGNVLSRNTIKVTGKTITGYVLATGDITFKETKILGGAATKGNYTQTGGEVNGVKAQENATIKPAGNRVSNDDLRYGGVGTFTNEASDVAFYLAPYRTDPKPIIANVEMVSRVPSEDATAEQGGSSGENCDPHGIVAQVSAVDEEANKVSGGIQDLIIKDTGKGGNKYQLTETGGSFIVNSDGSSARSHLKTATFINQSHQFVMFKNVTVKGHLEIAQGQDVKLYVQGNFKMEGNSSFTIPDNSSLTLVIMGAVDISSGAQIYTPINGISPSGNPVFSIFSSYSGTGITFDGGTEAVYAAIHAPETDVLVSAGVEFKGAIHANSITVGGNAKIHYDEQLGISGSTPGSNTEPKLVFVGWRYVTE